MDIILDISKKLDSFFIEKDLTAYRIAKITGLSEPTINRYRKGKSKPTAKNLQKLLEHFKDLEEYLNLKGRGMDGNLSIGTNISERNLNITVNTILNHEEELMKNKVFRQWYENKMLACENKIIKELTDKFGLSSK